jgi:phosphodiesterase/alkaline phosphatase D-like protein
MRRLILLAGAMMVALLLSAAPALAAGPTATTQPATNVTTTSATLNATVNAGGNVVISCQFEYGPTQSYGQTAPCSPTPSGSSDTNVSAQVSGLTPGTAYDYQVVLTTLSLNLTTTGGNQTFTTLNTSGAPTATTGQASQVFATTATLNGTVDPGSSAVSDCHFAYGTNPLALTSTAPCSSTPTGSGPQPVSASISGLSPSTQYYFALSATNSAGTSTGATQSFTTTASTPAPTATTGLATAITG